MSELYEDIIVCIIQYLNYVDMSQLRLVSTDYKSIIDKQEGYGTFLSLWKKTEKSENRMKNIFYSFIKNGRIDIATNIYLCTNLNLFIIKDIFNDKLCDKNNLESIVRIKIIREKNIFPNNLDKDSFNSIINVLENISRNCITILEYNNFFTYICKNEQAINLNKLEYARFLYFFGNYDKLDINKGFSVACKTNFTEMVKFILSVYSISENVIEKEFYDSCSSPLSTVFSILATKITKDEAVSKALLKTCNYSNIFAAQFILKYFSINESHVERAFKYSCKLSSDKFISLFSDFISMNTKEQMFIDYISDDEFVAAKSLMKYAHVSNDFVLTCFKEACLKENMNFVNSLIYNFNIDDGIVEEILFECCKKGQFKIVKRLYLSFNISPLTRLNCVLNSCRNGFYEIVKFITESYNIENQYLEEFIRENIEDNELINCFIKNCKENNLEAAKWYLKFIDIEKVSLDDVFIQYCTEICMYTLKFIMSLKKVEISTVNKCFLDNCQRGKMVIISELIDNFDIQKDVLIDGFLLACKYGHLDIVTYIYYKTNRSFYNNDIILIEVIGYHNKRISEWFLNTLNDEYNGIFIPRINSSYRCKYFSFEK